MQLDLSIAKPLAGNQQCVQQADVLLDITLPNGQQTQLQLREDLTVGFAKLQLKKLHGLPYDEQVLVLKSSGMTLADPLSLNDYKEIQQAAGKSVKVIVKLEKPESSSDEENFHDETQAKKNAVGAAYNRNALDQEHLENVELDDAGDGLLFDDVGND